MPDPGWLDLRALAADAHTWPQARVPGSSDEVRLHRLWLDADSRSTLSLVDFGAAWARPETGSMPVAEEFWLLSGELDLSGRTYVAGDLVVVPAHARRSATRARGAVALAWFGGVPGWAPDLDEPAAGPAIVALTASERRPGALPCAHRPACVLTDALPGAVSALTTVIDLQRAELLTIEPGQAPAARSADSRPGPFWVRTWH